VALLVIVRLLFRSGAKSAIALVAACAHES